MMTTIPCFIDSTIALLKGVKGGDSQKCYEEKWRQVKLLAWLVLTIEATLVRLLVLCSAPTYLPTQSTDEVRGARSFERGRLICNLPTSAISSGCSGRAKVYAVSKSGEGVSTKTKGESLRAAQKIKYVC